jgi:sigma-B regulation protein RsbU (phosphoserine phosphatase)
MIQPKSLQQRLALFLLLPVALLLFAVGAVGFIYARIALLTQWREAAVLKLQRAAHHVDMRMRHIKDVLEMVHLTAGEPNAEVLQDWVIEQIKGLDGVARVELVWTDEKRSQGGVPVHGLHEEAGGHGGGRRRPRGAMRFQEARIADVTPPRYDDIVEHQTVSLISDLIDGSGNVLGRLEVAIRFDYLLQDVVTSGWWQSNSAFLVNSTGTVLICTVPGGRQCLGDRGDPLEVATLKALTQEPSGTLLGPGFPPSEVSGFYRLEEAPWSLVAVAPGREILAPMIRFRTYYFITAAVFIPLVLLLMRWVTRPIVISIEDVARAAARIAVGEHVEPLPVKSADEVGRLIRSFNTMADQLEERMRLKAALDVAMEVQQSLLPRKPPEIEGLDIAGRSLYCDETGGDYYDFLDFAELGPGRIGIVVGDVVGHGIGAALLMTTARALLRSRITQPGSVAQMITDVNRLLCLDTAHAGSFLTLFWVLLDPLEREFRWVRAGHDPAMVYEPSADAFSELRGDGMALGIDNGMQFQEYTYARWAEGLIILIGTDGIWETENPQGESFGKQRVQESIREHRECSSQEIVQAILDALVSFRQTAPQEDDITLVVVKIGR